MDLMEHLLDDGRTLCTDNYYTSVSLAIALLQRKTHLMGTLRSIRKYNPRSVIEKNLSVGEYAAEECKDGITIVKWKDRRDVLVLSTKHKHEMVVIKKRNKEIQKPRAVIEYNKYKSYIDISDQLKSYNTSLRKSLKWYRKLAIELLLGTMLVNAFIAYQEVANDKISITSFRENITERLIKQQITLPENIVQQHSLQNLRRSQRRRSVVCFAKIKAESGRNFGMRKTPQTTLKCIACEKHYCLDCFFQVHSCSKIN